jgi:hypothetical protein
MRCALSCLALLFVAAAAAAESPATASADARAAIAVADAFLPSLDVTVADYSLVGAQRFYDGRTYVGPDFWRMTYKSCGARALTVEPVCKGGELYVGVDMKTRTASFIGAGE